MTGQPTAAGTRTAAPTPADLAAVTLQLGRPARSVHVVAHRCGCGLPDVVTTAPRLPDGTPFPTTYYLTCPRAASAVGRLEGSGVMAAMTAELATDPILAAGHRAAHEAYLAARNRLGAVPEIAGVSAGGMPDRVKCLHVLAAQELADGPGVNPLGARVVAELDSDGSWGSREPCVDLADAPLTVRRADRADLSRYLAIRNDAARWMLEHGIDQWQPGEYDVVAAAGQAAGDLWVADLAGAVVGGIRLMTADPDVWPDALGQTGLGQTGPGQAGVTYLHGLVVDRSVAGLGLGRRLLDWAAEQVLAGGGHLLRLDCRASNDRLRAFYPSAGYTELDVRDVRFAFRPGVTRLARFERQLNADGTDRADRAGGADGADGARQADGVHR